MIEIWGLTKSYRGETAVDALTFSVRPGMVTGFLGPNGAGKSTTIRMLLGLARPDRGWARIDGKPYARLGEPMRKVGALLETARPHKDRSAVNHLLWLAQSNGIGRSRVWEVLDQVGLHAAARRRTGGYSLGMAQRLGLAAALLGDPAVLVLDEPVNGLDPEGIRWLRELLRHLAAEGRTVFVSSHLMAEMAQTADHLVVIHKGRLLADTPTRDFIARNAQAFVRVRTREPEQLSRRLASAGIAVARASDGSLEVSGVTAAEISRLAAAGELTLDELSTQDASLEEAFLKLTGADLGVAR